MCSVSSCSHLVSGSRCWWDWLKGHSRYISTWTLVSNALWKLTYTLAFVVAQAIINLMATLKRPPVSEKKIKFISNQLVLKCRLVINRVILDWTQLLFTIAIYSSSVGHCKQSLQRSSRPWPRWRLRSSSSMRQLRIKFIEWRGQTVHNSVQFGIRVKPLSGCFGVHSWLRGQLCWQSPQGE